MAIDTHDAVRVVQNKNTESDAYLRQLHVWLGIGSAGGAIAMVSLASNLPDPAYAFRFLQLSLWSFLLGVTGAGAAVLFLSLRASAMASHVASAHNRDSLNEKIGGMTEMISSPPRMAEEANRPRNHLIEKSNQQHAHAEQAWLWERRYRVGWALCLSISALSFVSGFAWPLAQISFLGRSLLP